MTAHLGEPGNRQEDIGWLLDQLLKTVPGTRSALLLSADGLSIAASGSGEVRDRSDTLSAIASAAVSLAKGTSKQLNDGGVARQVVFVLGTVTLFICSAAEGSVLAVLAAQDSDAGLIGWEMNQLAKSVGQVLATPERPRPVGSAPRGVAANPLPARTGGADDEQRLRAEADR